MYAIKAQVFNYLTKNQKASLCSFLRTFTKRYPGLCLEDILNEFVEEEQHFYDMASPHFHFAVENFENDEFIRDLKLFISAVLKEIEYKESQKPYIEEQKRYAKMERKRAQEYKMSHEKPSVKQLKYYKSLCKTKGLEPKELEEASKLDLKTWISELVEESEDID